MSTLSVIVPVYNAEKYMDQCIESIVKQTYKDLEIILVNDGSTDKSGEMCDVWAAKDNRIKVIHKENGGVSTARNAGLDVATGDYVAFVDSDDTLLITAYEKSIKEIQQHNLDLLIFGYETVFPDYSVQKYMDCTMFTRYEYKENISKYISSKVGFASTCHKIYRTDIINMFKIHFDEDIKINEDGIFNCQYFTHCHYIKCIPDIFYFYNRYAANSTDKGRIDYLPQGKRFAQAMIDAVQSKGLYGFAADTINDWYKEMLHIHLMFILLPNDEISDSQRIFAIDELYNSRDGHILEMHLKSLGGIKNKIFYLLYKAKLSRLLITAVKIQAKISGGK